MASASNSTLLTAPGSSTYKYTLAVSFNETGTNTANNYSTVTCSATLSANNISYSSTNGGTLSIYWHDNKNNTDVLLASEYISSCGMSYGSKTVSGSYTAYHNNDGNLSGYAYAYFTKNKTLQWIPASGGVSTAWTALTYIPRQANLTAADNFNDDGNPKITYSNPAGNAVSSLQACISLTGSKDDVKYRDISKTGTSYTFNLTNEERDVLLTAAVKNTLTVTFFVRTVIGGNTFYSTLNRTMTVVNANPTFTDTQISYADAYQSTTTITGDNQKIIRGFSDLTVTFTAASAKKKASIVGYDVTFNGETKRYTSHGTIDFGTINNTSDTTITISAVDSRGNSTPISKTISVINYSIPTLSSTFARVQPTNGEIKLEYSGNWFNAKLGKTQNTLKIYYKYKEHDSSTWSQSYIITPTIKDNTFEGSISPISGTFDYRKAFDFQMFVEDAMIFLTPDPQVVTKGIPVFWWNDDTFNIEADCNLTTYSEVETICGTWINGKKIYRKVITFSDTSAIDIGVDVDTMVNQKMMIKNKSDGGWRNVPWLFSTSSTQTLNATWGAGFYITGRTCNFQVGSNIGNISYGHLIIEYTKP